MANFIDTITPQDFKNYFKRGFIYASIWDNSNTYNVGNVVYYNLTNSYYQCLNTNVVSIPTTTNDWLQLAGTNYVLDEDITKAFLQAKGSFNTASFSSQDIAKMVFLYLTAHYLCIDFNLQGLSIGGGTGIITSKSVDDVAIQYGFPQRLLNSPFYFQLLRTGYGAKALTYIYSNSASKMYAILGGETTP